jgi:hypothetical protein
MSLVARIALALAVTASSSSLAAVGLSQRASASDRSFDQLPDLRLLRGAQPRRVILDVRAEPNERWSVSVDAAWVSVTPSAGSGPGSVVLRFSGEALAVENDPTGAVTILGEAGGDSNRQTLPIAIDIYPDVFDGELVTGSDDAALREWARHPENWPKDGFDSSWEAWGFLPDNVSHPGQVGDGATVDVAERTSCSDDVTTGCTRAGQAGLVAGMKADQGWLLSTGDPAVLISVLDSGMRFSDRNVVNKHYLNANELVACPPPGADVAAANHFAGFDVDGDGMFTIRDYDDAVWLDDVNLNGVRDPQDLIWADNGEVACSDNIDDDRNGYVDDISGWDFFWNDNDPSDDADFGHGTSEAKWSVAEMHDDSGRGGICPRCMVLNVRVGDSFIVDVNQFAEGAVFAVDSGADVIQEALGALNSTPFAQAAIDYAYAHNVPVIASAADELSYHHNLPGSLEHTLVVHAIVHDEADALSSNTFLNFNNCTNFGGRLGLSTPGEACSSEATGNTAGQAGLVLSYFAQERARAAGTSREPYFAEPLTAEEVYQVLVVSAEDIDVDGAETDASANALRKYPSNPGWDLHFGYGRNDVRASLELVRDQRVPPAANISSPRWFQVYDPQRAPTFAVTATVDSPRLSALRWELLASQSITGELLPLAQGEGGVDDDVIFTVDIARDLPQMLARAADVASGDGEQFSGTLELRVFGTNPAGDEVAGVFRKTFGVRSDSTVLPGFPLDLGASGESSPKLTDLNVDGREEIVIATSDGRVHAIAADTTELPGFPVSLSTLSSLDPAVCAAAPAKCHRGSAAYSSVVAGIAADDVKTSVIATIAIGDLDGNREPCRDIVAASIDGFIFAIDCHGDIHPGFPVTIDRSTTPDGLTGARRCTTDSGVDVIGCRDDQQHGESGVFSTPMLIDLDRNGDLEIVAAGLDSRLYAWHHTGALVDGWPVHLDNTAVAAFNDDGTAHRLVDRIVASPTVADLFGDGTPWVVVGTTERVVGSGEVFLYAVHPDGNAHDGGPFAPNWPASVSGLISFEVLPYVGRGNPNSPAAADLDGDGDDEVVTGPLGGLFVVDGSGQVSDRSFGSLRESFGPRSNMDETGALSVLNNPSIGDLDGDGTLDVVNGVAGLGLLAVAQDAGNRANYAHGVGAWLGNGYFADGFPKKAGDFQFFMNYAIADIDGDGKANVISGDGGYFVWATNPDGTQAPGYPKWTQGWHISTPAVGDLDGDSHIDVVASTREGFLYAWASSGHVGGPPDAATAAIQWESFHRDDQNTANASGRFAALKPYARLRAPDDACEGGCCCEQNATNPSSVAGFVGLVTLAALRRRRRAKELA